MEKRKFERYEYSFRVLYKKVKSLFWMKKACTGNISRGGLKLKLKRAVPIGTILRVMIFNPFLNEPIEAEAEVVWINRNDHRPIWSAGLSFVHMRWTDSDRLLYGVSQ